MSEEITVKTNHVPRLVVDAYELRPAEREEFDYIDFHKVATGEATAEFVRYRGQLYDIGDFQYEGGLAKGSSHPFAGWDGFISDSFFSGILIRFVDDDHVVMGTFYC
jgi:hypothetical protein